jgi:uncharacterized membrane protein HdeD (DUF308 family)
MSNKKEELGVFQALGVVLIILGLLALAAHYLGWLPTF